MNGENLVVLAFVFGYFGAWLSETLLVFVYTRFWEKPCKRRCKMWSCKEYKYCIFSGCNRNCFSCKKYDDCEPRKRYLPDYACSDYQDISLREWEKRRRKKRLSLNT